MRIALREIGFRTPESVTYPGLERKFVVEYDPVWRWIAKGVREPGVLKFAEDHIPKGSTVVDIGAHVGEWALLFSELVGPAGKVVAFEPDPVARASLKKNLATNGVSNVTVVGSSVSDRNGKALLSASRLGSGLSSIIRPPAVGGRYRVVEVPSTTLDDYCTTNGLSPKWVKIDAEGAEPLIIRGMDHLAENLHPSVILEFHSDSLGDEEKKEAWSVVTRRAKTIEFLQSRRKDHKYLETLPKDFLPDCGFLVVHIQY